MLDYLPLSWLLVLWHSDLKKKFLCYHKQHFRHKKKKIHHSCLYIFLSNFHFLIKHQHIWILGYVIPVQNIFCNLVIPGYSVLPCRPVVPSHGQVPCAELGQRTVQPYQCSPHSRDIDLEHTGHLHLLNPVAGYHCVKRFCF